MLGLGPIASRIGDSVMYARYTPTSEIGVELPPAAPGVGGAAGAAEHASAAVDAASGGTGSGSGTGSSSGQADEEGHQEDVVLRWADLVLVEYQIL